MTSSVGPVPEGYHTVTPYLIVSDAARALEFYRRAFGAVELMRIADPRGQVGQAVAAGATILRPVEDKFYGDRTGSVRDPFGHVWHIATHKEDVPTEEIVRRAAAASGHS